MAIDPARPERLLALASEIVGLERRLEELRAQRATLWAQFSRASGPDVPSVGSEELQSLRTALERDDAVPPRVRRGKRPTIRPSAKGKTEPPRRPAGASEPPDAEAIDTGWGGAEEV